MSSLGLTCTLGSSFFSIQLDLAGDLCFTYRHIHTVFIGRGSTICWIPWKLLDSTVKLLAPRRRYRPSPLASLDIVAQDDDNAKRCIKECRWSPPSRWDVSSHQVAIKWPPKGSPPRSKEATGPSVEATDPPSIQATSTPINITRGATCGLVSSKWQCHDTVGDAQHILWRPWITVSGRVTLPN